MSSGRTHRKITKIAAIPTGIVVAFATHNVFAGIFAAFGCGVIGQVITPDLDVNILTDAEYLMIKRFGYIGWMFTLYWYPYAKMMKHRSIWSHFPIVSTLGRALYQFWWALIPIWYFQIPLPWAITYAFVGTLIGLMVSDTLHWLADVIT